MNLKIFKSNFLKFLFLLLFFGAILVIAFYFWQKAPKEFKPLYTQTYRLVPEKISQSSSIIISLPEGIDKEEAQKRIKFKPEIKGRWLKSDKAKEIIFQPRRKLQLNRYYRVELIMPDGGVLKGDFLAVEDPAILAIFPQEGSEVPENSEITIVFNRPMVPLTSLGYLEGKDLPVEITPPTEGRFKWITTRNLQFIPKERLKRSSNYTIKIKPGFVSMDNLKVRGKESRFTTRKLRYLNFTEGQIVYNQPISIYFNQPVDLERTIQEISLFNLTTGREIPFIAQYKGQADREVKTKEGGTLTFGNINLSNLLAKIREKFSLKWFQREEGKEQIDKSVIQIYNKEDRFGREKFWDFENSYSLKIKRAYPEEGDIILSETRVTIVYVTGPIKEITAESFRTRWASPDFFDPQGKLWVNFYENIDLKKSKIRIPKLNEIGFDLKCKDEEKIISKDIECEKEPDKKRIFITFKAQEIGLGERLEIIFEKIVNQEGLVINKEPIKKYLITFPKFQVIKTFPSHNSGGASLTEFVFCSNTPIFSPAKEDYKDYFEANLDYEINYWQSSWRVTRPSRYEECDFGQFHTEISYGLMPWSDYTLQFKLEDVFGQKLSYSLSFKTGAMPSEYLSFYPLQRPYNVTPPVRTKLTFAVQNMEYVNLDICKLEAFDFLYYLEKRPKYYEGPTKIVNCRERIQERIELPKRYWLKNYFEVNLKDYFPDNILGHYILTFSHPNYTTYRWEKGRKFLVYNYPRSYLSITNLAVAEKKIQLQYSNSLKEPLSSEQLRKLKNLYWVTEISSLEPVSGATINLYQGKGKGEDLNLVFAKSYKTNDQGIAFTDVIYDLKGVIITKGRDSTVIPSSESRLKWAFNAFSAKKIYLYTDKPIYRPGQEVFIKGIYRIGYDGNYEIYQEKPINLQVFNSKNDEIFNKDLPISDFGTFNTKLILERDTPLGNYRICAEQHHCSYFDVQEYVPAAFEVRVDTDKEEYISKDTVNLKVRANYYFGVPLEGGEVTYTISSQNYYFDRYLDEHFEFGRRWYYWPPYSFGEKFLLRGKTSLNNEGEAEISQPIDFESFFKNKEERRSKIIIVDVTVKDNQGRSISAQKSFIMHAGLFYLGLKADKSFLAKDEKTNLRIKSVDTQGKEIRVKNGTLDIYKIEWVYNKRLGPDGGYHYTWEKKRDLVKEYKFTTDRQGNFVQVVKFSQEGSYEIEAKARDKRGNLIWTTFNLYVWGRGIVSVRPTKDTELEIEAEKIDLNVGERANLIIKSPYPNAKALISLERGEIFDYQIREIEGSLYRFSFEIQEEYIPNIFASVLLLSPEPEIKFGQVEFKINTKRRELDIEVTSNKKYYLPGEEVILDILTKDYQGKPVSAEISLAVVDLSVLALKGNPKKNPLVFFYSGFPLTVQTSSNIKNILIKVEIPTKGGGGRAEEELARRKRGIFKETAFWQAIVRTDDQGKAKVSFTLPDNLTTWQIESVGLTKDTKLGVDYQEFITKKELMVVPLRPRFVVPGDIFQIGAKIFNQSNSKQNLKVIFNSSTLELKDDDSEKEITLKAGQTETIYFKVKAPNQIERGQHRFLLSAKSRQLEDTVEQVIDITENATYEVTATANYTPDEVTQEYVFLPDNIVKDKGNLSLKASATLAVFLSDGLNYLLAFPYGCSEQIASKLDAIAIVKRGLNLPNLSEKLKLEKIKHDNREYTIEELVEIGLAEIYNNQQANGGFSFWRNGESNFYLTLHLIDTLYNLSLAGFEINQSSLKRAVSFIEGEIRKGRRSYESPEEYKNRMILAGFTLFRLPQFRADYYFRQEIERIANDNLFIQEKISNSSLAYLAILLAQGNFPEYLTDRIYTVLENKIDIDARGAFLETGKNINWRYFETPIKNTALYLKALVADKREPVILDKVLRWLLNNRAKDGAWGSTNNTITVIDALTDFLVWKRETESNFTLKLEINKKPEGEFRFQPETILEQFKKEFSLQALKFNENNLIEFLKTNHNNLPNNLYYDITLKYYLPAYQIPPKDEGFSISREFYALDDKENKVPLLEAKVGDVLRVNLQITVPKTRKFVMIEDFIPAGFEIVNLDLATEEKSLRLQERELKGREFQPDFKEMHDDRLFLFKENLSPGVYEFEYYVRALIKGKFLHLPAVISEMYFPETFGRTEGRYFEVK